MNGLEQIEVRSITSNVQNHSIIVECKCKQMSRPFKNRAFKYEKFEDGVIQNAFDKSERFRVLLDHDKNKVIGTKANSTLYETVDGFVLEVKLSNTEENRNLLANIETMPDIISCSFGFRNKGSQIIRGVRYINAIELVEVSVLYDMESQYDSQLVDLRALEDDMDETLKDDLLKIYQEMCSLGV